MPSELPCQPISQLFRLGQQIERLIRDDLAQQQLHRRFKFDEEVLNRSISVFQAQLEEITGFYGPQFEDWRGEDLSPGQRQYLNRASVRLATLRELVEETLALLEKIAEIT
ncbi:MAG TPA: hypothetical protein VKQ72_00705 [Aggregatilineales bacterium]|nr:hypothetical protein [Aggregatilineales bacterium]